MFVSLAVSSKPGNIIVTNKEQLNKSSYDA